MSSPSARVTRARSRVAKLSSADKSTEMDVTFYAAGAASVLKESVIALFAWVLMVLSGLAYSFGNGLFWCWDQVMDKSGRKRTIPDREGKDPYLIRYYMLLTDRSETFPFNVFIHRFIKGDDDHVHDHPWGYFTLILAGGYYETVYDKNTGKEETIWRSPGFYQKVTSNHVHKITLKEGASTCWTLFVPFRRTKEWGFLVKKENQEKLEWVDAGDYFKTKKVQ